jgi:glycosyltransferase involved in cell wall biosynthesis
MIRLSVALVTRNRPDSLALTLKSLRSQSVQPYEVVISDDSDPERCHETKDVADRWDCRYIQGPRKGLYGNRNHVALACEGTHIRTMDDDHLFPAGHFAECLEAVTADPTVIWTTGEKVFNQGMLERYAPTAGQLIASGVSGAVKDLDNNWAIADGSSIYPRSIFDQGHRMVEWYPYGSSYLEFGAYLYKLGYKSRCIPNSYIEQYPPPNTPNRNAHKYFLESYMFAALCYQFYFSSNFFTTSRYILPSLVRLGLSPETLEKFQSTHTKAKMRWQELCHYQAKHTAAEASLINLV